MNYLYLLQATIQVVVLLRAVIASPPFGGSEDGVVFYVIAVLLGFLFFILTEKFRGKIVGRYPKLLEPVSDTVGASITNSIVIVWVVTVFLIGILILSIRTLTPTRAAIVLLPLMLGILVGRFIQRQFQIASSLPYALSMFIALVLIILIFAIAKPY